MSRRRVKPVEKGHLFVVLVVIIVSICCEAAPDVDNFQNSSSSGSFGEHKIKMIVIHSTSMNAKLTLIALQTQ